MNTYIFANPFSGNKKGLSKAKSVQLILKKYNIDSEIIESEYPGFFTKKARELSSISKCRIYVIGGDGTINEVVNGIVNTTSEIVIIPCGTGNDFLKSISKYSSMRKIVEESINKESSKVDAINIVNKNMYSINILSVGFDAMVAKNVNKFRRVPFITGSMKYKMSIFYTLMSDFFYKFKIRTDTFLKKGTFTLIAVANGKFYGGSIIPCPMANVHDGKLDCCIISKTTILKKLKFLPKFSKGKHTNLNEVSFCSVKEIKIVSTRSFPVNIDGEIINTNRLHLKVIPNALNVVIIDK